MTFALNLLASNEVEWSRTLMIVWLAIVLTLSVIEVFLLRGRSSAKVSKVTGTLMFRASQ
jgi:hypothetical protein